MTEAALRKVSAEAIVASKCLARPVSVDPGEEALDDPASWQDDEPDLTGRLLDHLDDDRGCLADPFGAVAAVDEGPFDEGERLARGLEQRDGAVAVLQIGAVGLQHERTAVGVDHGVTLAAFDLLA